MTGAALLCRRVARLGGAAAGLCLLLTQQAAAFPISDAESPSIVPSADASDSSDASALAHQLSLLNGYSSSVGPGWTFTPSLTLQEALNDNVFDTSTNRQWDLITYLIPSLAIYGDTQNVQLRFNYQPTVEYYARNTSLNQLAEQLNATADVTLWQDHLYLDLRAFAGVGSSTGASPGLGYGSNASGQTPAGLTGLNKQNSTQFTSFQVSPYFLQQFDTYGTLKVGYTLGYTTSSNSAGFSPVPTSSTGPSTAETTNEELIQFRTGTFLERISDTVQLDAQQFQGTGVATSGFNNTFTNQIDYVMNRTITLFGSLGYEDIDYGGANSLAIHDITWQLGTTLTPDPRSTLTLSYGHSLGVDTLSANGTYSVTARTSLNVSYGETLGTQLQSVQQQLSQTAINNSGVAVNSQTGVPLYNSNNLLGTQNQLYRATTATVGTNTRLDRDTITFNLQYAVYNAAGTGATGSTSGVTGTANWNHALRDDLTLNAAGSYGIRWGAGPGGRSAFTAVTTSLQYAVSATVSSSLSYSFYDLNSTESGGSLYQDILILSLTKRF
jgi:uncharacterized protein (PEP-CTERM system associated)